MSVYRDLNLSLFKHSTSHDVTIKEDKIAIINSIRNILHCSSGDKPFARSFGANLKNFLFEVGDVAQMLLIEHTIKDAIRIFEPRVTVRDIQLMWFEELHDLNIFLELSLTAAPEVVFNVNETIRRLR